MKWSEEMEDRLRALVRIKSETFTTIAARLSQEFNVRITIGAIAGRMSRLGLKKVYEPEGGFRGRDRENDNAGRRRRYRERRERERLREAARPKQTLPSRVGLAINDVVMSAGRISFAIKREQTKNEIRREFEEAWANTAKLQVADGRQRV